MNQKPTYENVELKNGANLGIELFILQIFGQKKSGHTLQYNHDYQTITGCPKKISGHRG